MKTNFDEAQSQLQELIQKLQQQETKVGNVRKDSSLRYIGKV